MRLYVFERGDGRCVFYHEWKDPPAKSSSSFLVDYLPNSFSEKLGIRKTSLQPAAKPLSPPTKQCSLSDEMQLVYGVVHTICEITEKLSSDENNSLLYYQTHSNSLHYLETATGFKFALMADGEINQAKGRSFLAAIASGPFLKFHRLSFYPSEANEKLASALNDESFLKGCFY